MQEAERAAQEEEERQVHIARGNPLLNPRDFTMKRRWDDDVVFKNQARGTEDKGKKKEFINDMLRSDFHKKFMVRELYFPTLIDPTCLANVSSSRAMSDNVTPPKFDGICIFSGVWVRQ